MASVKKAADEFMRRLELGEIPCPDPNDPSLFPQCYTNGYLIISTEAWARGVRLDDLCEGMPAAIYWNGSYGTDHEIGTPATIEVIRRAKKTGRIREVDVRREDGVGRIHSHVDPNFIKWISADHGEDPLAYDPAARLRLFDDDPPAKLTFTMRSYGTLLCKGTYGHTSMRLVIGSMFIEQEKPERSADLPY